MKRLFGKRRERNPARELELYRMLSARLELELEPHLELMHSYYDAGTFGEPRKGGHAGIRHWGGADATYRDAKVTRLEAVEKPEAGKEKSRQED